jgi:hypothetical protein
LVLLLSSLCVSLVAVSLTGTGTDLADTDATCARIFGWLFEILSSTGALFALFSLVLFGVDCVMLLFRFSSTAALKAMSGEDDGFSVVVGDGTDSDTTTGLVLVSSRIFSAALCDVMIVGMNWLCHVVVVLLMTWPNYKIGD